MTWGSGVWSYQLWRDQGVVVCRWWCGFHGGMVGVHGWTGEIMQVLFCLSQFVWCTDCHPLSVRPSSALMLGSVVVPAWELLVVERPVQPLAQTQLINTTIQLLVENNYRPACWFRLSVSVSVSVCVQARPKKSTEVSRQVWLLVGVYQRAESLFWCYNLSPQWINGCLESNQL